MTPTRKKRTATVFPRKKIQAALQGLLGERKFEIKVANSLIGKSKIVRIITPAWKNQRPWQRIEKVLAAVDGKLTPAEKKQLLRYSVLTPEEYKKTY
jgi:hypothetical protein